MSRISKKISADRQGDIIISLGIACRPAHWLRKANLRLFANPLDWMMRYSLQTVIELFQNNFEYFFQERKEHTDKKGAPHSRYVEDTKTGMIAMHSFPQDQSLDEFYPFFIKTMKKRFFRLSDKMKESKKIIFLSNRNEPIENIRHFLQTMSLSFSSHLTYINIRNSENESLYFETLNSQMEIIEYSFKDEHPDGPTSANPNFWIGNPQKWEEVMAMLSLTKTFQENQEKERATREDTLCQ